MARLRSSARASRGFSLVELMVSVAIGLVVTLIIFNVLIDSESRKRSTTSVNDINQSGAYGAYMLDRAIRSAGSGFSNQRLPGGATGGIEGCPLSVQRGATVLAPAAAAYPAPFGAVAQAPVLAPVIIDQGADSDVITIMSGSGGLSEAGVRTDVPVPPLSSVSVGSELGFRAGDLVLFAHVYDPAAAVRCAVSQVAGTTPPPTPAVPATLTLGGTYAPTNVTDGVVSGDIALSLGNPVTSPPQFRMYGVDVDRQLVSFDLLYLDGTAPAAAVPAPVAEGVVTMRAIYGIDTNGDNLLDSWVSPDPLSPWSGTALRNGSVASGDLLRQIVAIRLVLVMRTSLLEKEDVQATRSFNVYTDLPPGSPTRTISFAGGDTARYRYRVIESTIPLRNTLL